MRASFVGRPRHVWHHWGVERRGAFLGRIHLATIIVSLVASSSHAQHERSRFATEDTRSDYVHRIDLYDSRNTAITSASGRPYSPSRTCDRCHDVAQISHGFHFSVNPEVQANGRPGEPFIWVDPATGTQLPLTERGWPNSHTPESLGITPWDFALRFGKRTSGGYPGLPAKDEAADAQATEAEGDKAGDRFALSGPLEVDCMICHARGSTFDMEGWSKQIDNQNLSWAPTVALGLAKVDGAVRRIPDSALADTAAVEEHRSYPKTTYDPQRFDVEGKVFLDIVRTPEDNACYRCHSSVVVGEQSSAAWMHEQDVHLRAGLKCVDCHANGLGHETVRGFEGEQHPAQDYAASLSCRGCHMGTSELSPVGGGGLGAPYPEHAGLPPFHFERLSCTACHAGSLPSAQAGLVQTSRNHLLGQSGHRLDHQQPEIVESVLMPNEDGVLYSHHVMWPSYWGMRNKNEIAPLDVNEVQKALRSVLRVRKDFVEELTRMHLTSFQKADVLGEERAALPADELTPAELAKLSAREELEGQRLFHKQLHKGLLQLKQQRNVDPVYVAAEKLYQLDNAGELEIVANPDPQPFAWPIGHDVRPARWALGANGCTDCHSADSAFLYASVTPEAPVPTGDLSLRPMHEFASVDETRWSYWNSLLQAKPLLLVALAGSAAFLTTALVRRGQGWPSNRKAGSTTSAWSPRERAAYFGFVVSVALLGFTSLSSMWRYGILEGWWLLAHMIAAGLYLACLFLVLLLVSHRFRHSRNQSFDAGMSWSAVQGFWLMMALSLVVVVTILLSMLPYFGTEEQVLLITLHRYSGLALLGVVLIHPFLLGRQRKGSYASRNNSE